MGNGGHGESVNSDRKIETAKGLDPSSYNPEVEKGDTKLKCPVRFPPLHIQRSTVLGARGEG